jgi:hypothetical protein
MSVITFSPMKWQNYEKPYNTILPKDISVLSISFRNQIIVNICHSKLWICSLWKLFSLQAKNIIIISYLSWTHWAPDSDQYLLCSILSPWWNVNKFSSNLVNLNTFLFWMDCHCVKIIGLLQHVGIIYLISSTILEITSVWNNTHMK